MLRFYAASLDNRSEVGSSIWEERVVPSTIKDGRVRKEIEEFKTGIQHVFVDTPQGPILLGGQVRIPVEFIERVFIRITKGLRRHFHPEIKCAEAEFEVEMLNQYTAPKVLETLPSSMTHIERGGVFHCWYMQIPLPNDTHAGQWAYSIYNALAVRVLHGPPDFLEQVRRITALPAPGGIQNL